MVAGESGGGRGGEEEEEGEGRRRGKGRGGGGGRGRKERGRANQTGERVHKNAHCLVCNKQSNYKYSIKLL